MRELGFEPRQPLGHKTLDLARLTRLRHSRDKNACIKRVIKLSVLNKKNAGTRI